MTPSAQNVRADDVRRCDDVMTFRDVAKQEMVSWHTVRKWATSGYRGVILNAVQYRGHWYTRKKWVDAFNDATLTSFSSQPSKPKRRAKKTKRSSKQILRERGVIK